MPSRNGHAPTFEGFSSPNYTQVPDELFDVLMPQLGDAELRVLLYIIRRTFGFKRESDNISLSQMVDGIRTSDGRVLDSGTGLSKATIARALNTLKSKGIIVGVRNRTAARGNEATTYRLRFRGETGSPPLVSPVRQAPLSQQRDNPLSQQRDTQETVIQETDEEISKFERSHDEQISNDGGSRQQAGIAAERQETAPDALESAQRPNMPLPPVSRVTSPQNAQDGPSSEDDQTTAATPGYEEFRRRHAQFKADLAERHSMDSERPTRRRSREVPHQTTPEPQPVIQTSPAEPQPIVPPAIVPSRGRPPGTHDERDRVFAYFKTFMPELHDQAPLHSSISRAINLFKRGNIPPERWDDYLCRAKTETQWRSATIDKQITLPSGWDAKNKVPYYFGVLEDLIGLKPQPNSPIPTDRSPRSNEHLPPASSHQSAAANRSMRTDQIR